MNSHFQRKRKIGSKRLDIQCSVCLQSVGLLIMRKTKCILMLGVTMISDIFFNKSTKPRDQQSSVCTNHLMIQNCSMHQTNWFCRRQITSIEKCRSEEMISDECIRCKRIRQEGTAIQSLKQKFEIILTMFIRSKLQM